MLQENKNVQLSIENYGNFPNYPSIKFNFISPINQNIEDYIINVINDKLSKININEKFITKINKSKDCIMSWGLKFNRHEQLKRLEKLNNIIDNILV